MHPGRRVHTDTSRPLGPASPPPPEIEAGTVLSSAVADRLRGQVTDHLAAGAVVVRLRLDGVKSFDTSGLGLLLGLHRLARGDGCQLVCVAPSRVLWAVIRRRGLHRVLSVELDVRAGQRPQP
jgi:anti-anti-sigma factor